MELKKYGRIARIFGCYITVNKVFKQSSCLTPNVKIPFISFMHQNSSLNLTFEMHSEKCLLMASHVSEPP